MHTHSLSIIKYLGFIARAKIQLPRQLTRERVQRLANYDMLTPLVINQQRLISSSSKLIDTIFGPYVLYAGHNGVLFGLSSWHFERE